MRVLLSGSSGLIGSRLMTALRGDGATVTPLLRGAEAAGAVLWDPERGVLDPRAVSGFDAVIHLAGEPVASGRWTEEKKRKIYDSRARGTETLSRALAAAEQPPRVFLCASGINFYGDRGDAVLPETEPRGGGFLAEVCEALEAATEPLRGVARITSLRIGVVLPVTNREFTEALAEALHRPAPLPVPGWAVRALFGQFGEETVLSSVRAVPARLLRDGFVFRQPTLGPALQDLLG